MYNPEQAAEVSQLIVLGRGKDGYNKLTTASYDRAVAASAFCAENPGVDTVIFSGGFSAHTEHTRTQFSEAALMADVAELPDNMAVIVEEKSENTTENILNSAEHIGSGRTVGIMAHRAQLRRALFIAERVLPETFVVGLPAEFFNARPEGKLTCAIEAAQLIWTRGLMLGVKHGNTSEIHVRNEYDRHIKQMAGSGIRKVCKATRIPVPQQYR